MTIRGLAGLSLGSLLLAAQPALAGTPVGDPLGGVQAMRELNAIVFGDTKGWLTVQGKTFVGGDVKNGGEFGAGNAGKSAAASDRATLTVGGDISSSAISLKNGPNGGSGTVGIPASVQVGGKLGGININTPNALVQVAESVRNINGSAGSTVEAGGAGQGYLIANGGTITTGKGEAFGDGLSDAISSEAAKLEADLKALSLSLAGLDTTAGNSIGNSYGHWTFNAVADSSGVSVFNLSEAAFGAWKFTLNLADPATTVIFNITGDGSYNWNTGLAGAFAGSAGKVIWNFADAEKLNTSQTVYGSILAPWAKLGSDSAINGTVVADELKASSGVNLGTYGGSDFGLAEPVPEPGTWAMLIVGFGFVGLMLRRRQRAFA